MRTGNERRPSAGSRSRMSRQLVTNLAQTIGDERLRPFLPLIYTAWSDGELTADEIEGICTAVAKFRGIDEDCQVALRHWLDPDVPPSPDELDLLRLRIASWAAELDKSRPASVVDLGIAIAERTRADATVTDDERSALEDVVNRLGPLPPPPATLGELVRLPTIETPSPTFEVGCGWCDPSRVRCSGSGAGIPGSSPRRKPAVVSYEASISVAACPKSCGATLSGHGGGRTTNFARSWRCLISTTSRLVTRKLAECKSSGIAPLGGSRSPHAVPLVST